MSYKYLMENSIATLSTKTAERRGIGFLPYVILMTRFRGISSKPSWLKVLMTALIFSMQRAGIFLML